MNRMKELHKARLRKHRAKLKEKAHQAVGRVCQHCGATPIQFAHVRPTKLSGRGRGSVARYKDVAKFPKRYIPLCAACHYDYDNIPI